MGSEERMRERVVPAGCARGRPQRVLHRLDAAYVLQPRRDLIFASPSVVRAYGGRSHLAAFVEPHRRQLSLSH